jgi:hypothetical protein
MQWPISAQSVAQSLQQGTSRETPPSSSSEDSSVVSPAGRSAGAPRSPGGQLHRASASGGAERPGVREPSRFTSLARCSGPAWRGLAAATSRDAPRGDATRARVAAGAEA